IGVSNETSMSPIRNGSYDFPNKYPPSHCLPRHASMPKILIIIIFRGFSAQNRSIQAEHLLKDIGTWFGEINFNSLFGKLQMSHNDSVLAEAMCGLTIELDDVHPSPSPLPLPSPLSAPHVPHIGPPRRPMDVVVYVSPSAPIHFLPSMARTILVTQLDLPALSSMRNWESVGGAMELTHDELINLSRRGGSATQGLLNHLATRKINALLKALVEIGRVDILSSLRPILLQMHDTMDSLQSLSTMSTVSLPGTSTLPRGERLDSIERTMREGRRFVLLIHHEKDKEERKVWKWFLKNMTAKGAETEMEIVDVKEAMDGGGPCHPKTRRPLFRCFCRYFVLIKGL
ncbi:hypothetical protein PFISCL1PPCAC_29056, partial [Pristionchus fissidentatus]